MHRPVMLIVALAALSACGSGTRDIESVAPAKKVPSWFLEPPSDDQAVLAAATATSRDLQLAVDKAEADARLDVAQQLEVKYSALTQRFQEEVGGGVDSELLNQYTQTYRAVVSQVLVGTKARRQDIRREGGVYRAYVLMAMPVGEANAALTARIRSNEHLYTRFRASQAFKELERQVKEYETWKREQGVP